MDFRGIHLRGRRSFRACLTSPRMQILSMSLCTGLTCVDLHCARILEWSRRVREIVQSNLESGILVYLTRWNGDHVVPVHEKASHQAGAMKIVRPVDVDGVELTRRVSFLIYGNPERCRSASHKLQITSIADRSRVNLRVLNLSKRPECLRQH